MRPNMKEGDNRLAGILKAGDPLRTEEGLSRSDSALMRQTFLEEAERAEGPGWIPLAAGAALAALSLAALLLVQLPDLSTPDSGRMASSYSAEVGAANRSGKASGEVPRRAARTIHFTTAGGTRVVWSLNPDFDIRTGRKAGPDRS